MNNNEPNGPANARKTAETITVVVAEPGKPAEAREIPAHDNLGALQQIVGGDVQQLPWGIAGHVIMANADGKLIGLEPNREWPLGTGNVIAGTLVVMSKGNGTSIAPGKAAAALVVLDGLRVA